MIRARDLAERVFWSFISGFIGSLVGAPVVVDVIEKVADVNIDISAAQAMLVSATFAGLTAAANVILVIARWRLSVLPNPGDGLPGLPTTGDDGGLTVIEVAAISFLVCLTVLLIAHQAGWFDAAG